MKKNKLLTFIIAALFVTATGCDNTATNEASEEHTEKGMDMDREGMNHSETDHGNHDQTQSASSGGSAKSPRKSAMGNIGDTHIHLDYSAPSMRGRQIFGGLVAYDEVWTPGAHKATTINFYEDVTVEGQQIAQGKYGLFTIPGKETWTVILNENNDMHLADDYKQEEDVARFQIKPEMLNEPVEQLTFEVKGDNDSSGRVILKWADVEVALKVETKD